ncbi:hypothetical protein TNCV_3536371 [Trichonephila clavipes]|uniref:Uncharacterized protein n=1 Tax=Trichonephila clavipes TaxID=2585209 RepID=A0A8X6VWG4_TRICX|nr:hypothetical protein TNCV_3536371 [Trichonephila clavipes]
MIPILRRLNDSFDMVLVDDKTFPAFLTEYVLNCPELTTIELQVSKYFTEDEEYLTPDVLLDILSTPFFHPIVNMYTDENCIPIRTSPPDDVKIFPSWAIWK